MTMDRVKTLRARLLLGGSLATACVLLVAGLVIYGFVRASLSAEFDLALRSSVEALSALVEQDADGIKLEPEAERIIEFTRSIRPDYFSVWLEGGKVVASSASLKGGQLEHPMPVPGTQVLNDLTLPDGLHGRQATVTVVPPFEDPDNKTHPGRLRVTITLARHTAELEAKLFHLGWLLGAVGAAATLAAAGAMLLVVRRGLRPLESLAARIAMTGKDELGERIELSEAPAELTTVVLRLNELLDRVETTVVRERRFNADIAHELRTPLAGLEMTLDVCATRRRVPEEYEQTLEKCQRIVRGMHALVDRLMTLARADAQRLATSPTPVDVAALVQECWSAFERGAMEKGARASFEVDGPIIVETDREQLAMVVNNLLDNAVSHCNIGGWIKVESRAADGGKRMELCISNSGGTLTPAQTPRVFDRFWRGDASRPNTGVHCGLGLSLCRELVSAMSGEIEASCNSDGVFAIRVVLGGMMPVSAEMAAREMGGSKDRSDHLSRPNTAMPKI